MKKGQLIVLSGPSGVGKTTIRKRLLKEIPNLVYSISTTTRKPRIDEETNNLEINGKEYYFVTVKEFKEQIKKHNFLEYAKVYKNTYYGTSKDKVLELLDRNINVLLEIDTSGALQIKKSYPKASLIFIKPKSIDILKERLLKRNTDDPKVIKERLSKAKLEIKKAKYYDFVILSTTKEEDYKNVLKIIKKLL